MSTFHHSNPFRHEFWQIVGAFCTRTHTNKLANTCRISDDWHIITCTTQIRFFGWRFTENRANIFQLQARTRFRTARILIGQMRFTCHKKHMQWTWNRFETAETLSNIKQVRWNVRNYHSHRNHSLFSFYSLILIASRIIYIYNESNTWAKEEKTFGKPALFTINV